MEIVTKKINDLDLKVINTNKFKLVNIQVSFLMELEYEDIAAYNILLNMLITRNKKYPSIKEFSGYLESNYGTTISGGYFNRGNVAVLNIFSSAINSKFALDENMFKLQIDTIKDCIFNPILNEHVLDEIKTMYIEKLKGALNKKTYILKKKINSILGNNNPYGVNIESDIKYIEEVNLEKINDVYHKLLNSNARIYICGDVSSENLESLFDGFNLKSNDTSLLNLNYLKSIEKKETNIFESNFLQSAISLCYECNITYKDNLYYALKVFLEMLNYDLFYIIREKYNFCYYIYALSNNYLNTIEIVSEIESKNLDKIIKLIDEILNEYIINFDDSKFITCRDKIITYIKDSLDSPKDLIDLEFGFDFNKVISSINDLEDKYMQVSKDDIKEVVKMISLKMVSILKEANSNE